IEKLKTLVGADLRPLADQYAVTVWKAARKNKGWAGHTLERFLGLDLNSSHLTDFGDWELKQVQLVPKRYGSLRVKETMAITMIDRNVPKTAFEQSHLLAKLQRIVIVARVFESQADSCSLLHSVGEFDLTDPRIYAQVKADYETIRSTIVQRGF